MRIEAGRSRRRHSISITLTGRGPNIPIPSPASGLPLPAPVQVQLINSTYNICWEATYNSSQVMGSSVREFRAGF
jgi:hypothetical protein